jgi:flagellar assembly protein FliH
MVVMSSSESEELTGLDSQPRPFHYRNVSRPEAENQDQSRGLYFSLGGERRKENIEAIRRALEPEIQAREKQARDQGIREGESGLRAEVDQKIREFREALALSLKQFAAEREDYFHHVEGHVVKLSLAIARRILHREAQIDPLVLSGAVRVALEKVSSATMVRLFVHPDQIRTWREFLDQQNDMREKPEIVGDPSVVEGECRIESSIGSADLSLENQITEIERGFFDLLAQRPEIP